MSTPGCPEVLVCVCAVGQCMKAAVCLVAKGADGGGVKMKPGWWDDRLH